MKFKKNITTMQEKRKFSSIQKPDEKEEKVAFFVLKKT
jgi:hypothetical protein